MNLPSGGIWAPAIWGPPKSSCRSMSGGGAAQAATAARASRPPQTARLKILPATALEARCSKRDGLCMARDPPLGDSYVKIRNLCIRRTSLGCFARMAYTVKRGRRGGPMWPPWAGKSPRSRDVSAREDRVLQRHDPRPLIHPAPRQPQLRPRGRSRQQRNPAPEQDRDDGDLDRIHEPHVEEAAEELAAAEQPDVLARLPAQGLHGLPLIPGHDRHLRMVLLPERAGEDDHLARDLRPAGHGLERPAAHEERIELRKHRAEVDLRILDDPVELTVRSRDVAVQAGGDEIADAFHENLTLGVSASTVAPPRRPSTNVNWAIL